VEDAVLVVERGMTGATGNVYAGLYDVCEMCFLLHYLRSSDTFLDIGANVGSYTIVASAVVGAQTLAFEPIPQTFKQLARNLVVNEIKNRATAQLLAIGSRHESVCFSSDQGAKNRPVSEGYSGTIVSVEVDRLDNVIQGVKPAMIKIDVEGHEADVLAGAHSTLKSDDLRVVVVEGGSTECSRLFEDFWFSEIDYDPFNRTISRRSDRTPSFCNHIWVRDVKFIDIRCRNSRTYSVLDLEL
jgi:FkbM family methyltransferase